LVAAVPAVHLRDQAGDHLEDPRGDVGIGVEADFILAFEYGHLSGLDDDVWLAIQPVLQQSLDSTIGPHRSVSVATKVLHSKRPALFPVLDSLVIQQIGGGGRSPLDLFAHIRSVGRDNLKALSLIQEDLRLEGIDRSRVRILDVLLWSSHPAAGLAPQLTAYEHRFGAR
jgi:hypothetical protein